MSLSWTDQEYEDAMRAALEAWLLDQLHRYDCWGGETDADPDRHSMCKEVLATIVAALTPTSTWTGGPGRPEVQFSTPHLPFEKPA